MTFLKKFDIYPQTINFTMNGNPKYKTSIGGALAILNLILFVFFVFYFSQDYIHKINPAFFSHSIIEIDNHIINMNNPFTNIVLQPYRKDKINEFKIPSSLFYIQADSANYFKYKDGRPKENNFIDLGIKKCNISDFHESLHEYYNINNFNQSFCVNKDSTIQGSYTSDIFKFIKIMVKSCVGKDNFTGEKIICKDTNELIKEVSNWKLSLFLTYAIPNPSNYTQPFQTQIFNKGFVFYPAAETRENYFLSRDILSTDDTLLFAGSEYNMTLANYFGQDTAVAYNDLESDTVNLNFFTLYFRTHNSYTFLKRTYKKLPEILAGTVSIIQIFNISLSILYPLYNVIPFKLNIINSTFHHATKDEILMRKEIKKIIDSAPTNPELFKNCNTQNINSARTAINSELFPITNEIKGILFKRKATISERFNENNLSNKIKTGSVFCSKVTCRKNKNIFVYDHFNKMINQKLDFKRYLRIYEDLERIKDLILDDSQKIIFSFWLRKYSIDSNNNINSNCLQEVCASKEDIFKAINTVINRSEKTKIDYSVLNSLDIY